MHKIEKLINKLCPEDLKIVKLSEVAKCKSGRRLTKSQLLNHGYPVMSGGVNPIGYWNDYNYNENTTSIARYGTAGLVRWETQKFWAIDACWVITDLKDNIDSKYLYYVVKNKESELIESVFGTIPALSVDTVHNLDIPLPPRAIQDEIVKILDNFTELTTELKDRIKQYEYYRDKLLSFDDSKVKVEYKPLKELCSITTGKLNAKDAVDGGIYPFFTCDAKPYSINEYAFDTEAILLSGNGNIGHTNYYNGKFNAYQRTYVLHNFIEVNPKFLLHYINNSFKDYISQKSLNGVISYITLPILQEFSVPIPPLPVQNRIAEVLDNFEKICKDLKIGLPSEIQLRQKQYEYYRNLLLSFNIDDIKRERERDDNSGLSKLLEYVFGLDLVSYGYKINFDKLSNVAKCSNGKRVVKKELTKKGYPVVSGGISIMGYYHNYNFDENKTTIARYGSAGFVDWQSNKFWASDGSYVITNVNKDIINPKYLYYVIKNYQNELIASIFGTIPTVAPETINNLIIPIPPLSLQNQIVAILDNFSSYTNNLTQGLPVEINLRQKQYEYYRNKLLSFNK